MIQDVCWATWIRVAEALHLCIGDKARIIYFVHTMAAWFADVVEEKITDIHSYLISIDGTGDGALPRDISIDGSWDGVMSLDVFADVVVSIVEYPVLVGVVFEAGDKYGGGIEVLGKWHRLGRSEGIFALLYVLGPVGVDSESVGRVTYDEGFVACGGDTTVIDEVDVVVGAMLSGGYPLTLRQKEMRQTCVGLDFYVPIMRSGCETFEGAYVIS